MRRSLILFISILLTSCLWGQVERGWISKSAYVKAAEGAIAENDYFNALSYFLEALEYDSTDLSLLYETATVARHFSSYRLADQLYSRALDLDSLNSFPITTFWKGVMLQQLGRYESAKTHFNLYLSENDGQEGHEQYLARARKEISSCDWAIAVLGQAQENIEISLMGDSINTPNSEFGGVIEENGITFSSLKYYQYGEEEPEISISRIASKPISKVYTSDSNLFTSEYTELNVPEVHTAHTAYDLNRTRLYYTQCEYVNGNDIRCDIYYRPMETGGNLGAAVKLDSTINLPGYTSTQPNIAYDDELGQELLYFVSDRPDGITDEADLNIWYAAIEGRDVFGQPVFLADINTPADDITPFFHRQTQVLHFSSEGYTSLGGFDIYRSEKDNGGFTTPENLGAPVNSSFNDIYYTLDDDGEEGLFSSNRDSSMTSESSLRSKYLLDASQSCCYDIYEMKILELAIRLNALTFDSRTLDSLDGVTVRLYDADTGELIGEITNDLSNEHIFTLQRNRSYTIISTKDKYRPDTISLNTNSVFRSQEIVRRIYLEKSVLDLQVLTFDGLSRSPLFGTTVTLTDLTDPSNGPVVITNPNGNDSYFEIIPGHEYQLKGSRDRYYDDEITFTAIDEDGSGLVVKRLFLDRRDLTIFLPLTVFFDNDIPDSRTMSLTTNKTYTETFDDYVLKKQEFKDRYANGLTGDQRLEAEQEIEDFFINDVNAGFDTLHSFLNEMLKQLQQGKSFDLSIRGYASPRADSRYNLALGQRRVVSMKNEMHAYSNGVFLPFIDNGQLKITELSYGENLAPETVSDAVTDRRLSVYSPEASRERRVQIVEIKTQNLDNNN